ncbi:hypothetical protein [Sulfurimonas sp.]
MKTLLFTSLLTSTLIASIVQTSSGTFADLYADKNSQSNIVATISIDKGHLIKKRCMSNSQSQRWCRVKYIYDDIVLHGYLQEKTLKHIYQMPKKDKYFELSYGGEYDDVANDVVATEDGGYVMVGYTASFGNGQDDIYIFKTDKYGNKLYSLALGGSRDDEAMAVVQADNSSFMVAGYSESFGNGVESVYMARVSNNGNLIWQNAYYSDKDDYYRANDIVKISPNNFLLAGYENHVKFFSSETNIYLNAINMNAKRNGIKRYGGSKVDKANSIISVSDGYVIAGFSKTWGHGAKDAYVLKIDKKGKRLWHNAFGFSYDEVANQIIQTKDGGYILVGSTDSATSKQQDIFVVKMSASGGKIWQAHYGSREDDEGYGIVETTDGYVIAGYTKETKSYNSDVYLLKIDKQGNVIWHRKYGYDKDDEARAIIKVPDGFVITGFVTSEENYSKEIYILKVNEEGKI